MLNPDGVTHGNYRCSLAGQDMNREFVQPHKKLAPEVWHQLWTSFHFKKSKLKIGPSGFKSLAAPARNLSDFSAGLPGNPADFRQAKTHTELTQPVIEVRPPPP